MPYIQRVRLRSDLIECRRYLLARLRGFSRQYGIDLSCNLALPLIQPLAGAGFIGEVAVHGHIAAVTVVYAVLTAVRPYQGLYTIALANVCHKRPQGLIRGVCARIRLSVCGISHLDCDGPVIICAVGAAPGPVSLIDIQADTALTVNAVVAGCLRARVCKPSAAGFHRQVSRHAVNGNGINGMLTLPRVVRGQLGIGY